MSAKPARRRALEITKPVINSNPKITSTNNLNESRAVISGGGNPTKNSNTKEQIEVVTISSDSSSSAGEEGEDGEELSDQDAVEESVEDVAMQDTEVEAAEDTGEPSFGDLIRANAPEVIDVAAAFEDSGAQALSFPAQIQIPSGASLGTVLTQALKTNDISLLESCLHTTDVATIRATIQRLDSTLAGILLQKLAERLHKRPGRAGSLMVWVQWTLVTHGGFLATQPDLIKKLAGLSRVIEERVKGLPLLLSLKGKLDMLEAQTELRKNLQNQRRRNDVDDDGDGVIYVEGQESEEEDNVAEPSKLTRAGELVDVSEYESDASEDMPAINGGVADSEEEEDSDENEFLDDEAEETDRDDDDEDEVDYDDQDLQEDDEESEDERPPPSKLQRIGGSFSKKR